MKIVYGNVYFAIEAIDEVPIDIKELYLSAVGKEGTRFVHNLVKLEADRSTITLLYYPDLDSSPHPYLKNSLLIDLARGTCSKVRKESNDNPVILHRLETMLSKSNKRVLELIKLTKKEESLGLYSKENIRYIGRAKYWNQLCREKEIIESIAYESKDIDHQNGLLFDLSTIEVNVSRELTAMSTKEPSSPTKWAYSRGYITSVVYDWGCGRGRDSNWLKKMDVDVISFDPYYAPDNKPQFQDFNKVKTILLVYVLNVIERVEERISLLDSIKYFANRGTKIIIACRNQKEISNFALKGNWEKHNDGYLTQRGTFQKGFTENELILMCKNLGFIEEVNPNLGGLCCVISI